MEDEQLKKSLLTVPLGILFVVIVISICICVDSCTKDKSSDIFLDGIIVKKSFISPSVDRYKVQEVWCKKDVEYYVDRIETVESPGRYFLHIDKDREIHKIEVSISDYEYYKIGQEVCLQKCFDKRELSNQMTDNDNVKKQQNETIDWNYNQGKTNQKEKNVKK
jgi:hypothetical protein